VSDNVNAPLITVPSSITQKTPSTGPDRNRTSKESLNPTGLEQQEWLRIDLISFVLKIFHKQEM